jgi:uncharacterized protein (DUF305 family)
MAESNAAMNNMMSAMDIHPSGNVDADFVALMVPLHEAAVEMAQAETPVRPRRAASPNWPTRTRWDVASAG